METPTASALPATGDIIQKPLTEEDGLQPVPLKTPFKKMAMALSGGGFRAAAYSLGAMSYLHHLKYPDGTDDKRLLDNVEFISSASGGTFPAILYSMHVQQGRHFKDTYTALRNFMNGEGLLEEVLRLINIDSEWTEGKSRNFINAFARVYNKKLFDKETFGVYLTQNATTPQRPLEVCFNTTEFYRGLSFRFQASNQSPMIGKTGNDSVFFDKKDAAALDTLRKIRLGDIMAASSCFPAGFEPILYPKDFTYGTGDGLNTGELKKALIIEDYNSATIDYKPEIGFMDGGVDDNQGLYSAMLADQRRRRSNASNGFDLIFVTDVASYFMDPYLPPAENTSGKLSKDTICSLTDLCNNGINKIRKTFNISIIVTAVLTVLGVLILLLQTNTTIHNLALVVTSVAATLLVVGFVLSTRLFGMPLLKKVQYILGLSENETVQLLKKKVPAVGNFSDSALTLLLHHLKNTPLAVLQQLIMARINSLLSMLLDVNLKQTRRLIFNQFYGNFYGSNVWDNRRVFNVVYELSTFNVTSRLATLKAKFHRKQYQLPAGNTTDTWAEDCIQVLTTNCDKMQTIAESARTMGTTLWFDRQDANSNRMQDVIACGQFTTCVKLLEYTMITDRLLQIQALQPGAHHTIDFDEQQLAIFRSVKAQVEKDWEMFKTNPYGVIKDYE